MAESILGSPDSFLSKLFNKLTNVGIDHRQLFLDHICYRVETNNRYTELKTQLESENELLSETIISGRPIASFILSTPFRFQDRIINCLELPAPKEGSPYPEGYEHIEFVIRTDFENFMQKYPKLSFQTKGISKSINPDISIKLDDMTVKFHHHPLPYVIGYLD